MVSEQQYVQGDSKHIGVLVQIGTELTEFTLGRELLCLSYLDCALGKLSNEDKMDCEVLVKKLSEVIIDIPGSSSSHMNSISSFSFESAPYYQLELKEISMIIQYLASLEDVVSVFDDKMLNTGDGASRVTIEILARWLVRQAQLTEPESVVQKLDLFLKAGSTSCQQVLAISGIKVTSDVNIAKNIKLVPFDNLSESYAKEALYPPYIKPDLLLKLGFFPRFTRGYNPPEAAVVLDTMVTPQSYSEKEQVMSIDSRPLYEFCEFLTLIKSATPVPVACWCDLSDDTPCKQLLGGGWSGEVIDIMSRNSFTITQQDWDSNKELYLQFLSLPQDVRDQLRVPIERLNQARRRVKVADRAIDLGVAYEALFLNDKSHKEQISFTLRLRAALFLGGDYGERQELMSFFSAFYSCRSEAVHTGKLKTRIKVAHRGMVDAAELLEEGDNHCVQAIKKIISLGKFPDWNELMLKKG